ncbi:unnamed protein product, partial [Pocillopora meandrina]
MADEEELVLWLLLIIILRRQRQYRNNIVRKRKRFCFRDICRLRAALGEYINFVRELRLGDREFCFRQIHTFKLRLFVHFGKITNANFSPFRYIRMTPERFEHLLSLVGPRITKTNTRMREAIS